jgi:hypothetical protein
MKQLLSFALVFALPAALHAAPNVVRSAQSGNWSDGATWEGGNVPAAGDKVLVRTGHAVTYDARSDAVIRSVHVSGTLAFAVDRDTVLNAGLIKVQPGDLADEHGFDCEMHATKPEPGQPRPALLVGTPDRPIDAGKTAVIRLHYIDGMDRDSCPAVVCCGGRMEFHGQPMSRTWVKLGANAEAGDSALTLAEEVNGWKAGDRVVITGSSGNHGAQAPQTEERQVVGVRGLRLELNRPLEYHHAGEGPFRAEVANLSRNVVVESADPGGVRGHTMYHVHSAGSIGYAEFRHLGKAGVLGRYPVHFHLCRDTMRGSSVIGASIWDSANRWIAVHGTEYLVVRNTVGYRSIGHGFFLEDGAEVYNILDRNLAVRAEKGQPLPKQALPFDRNEGAGFWWANSHNTFTRNVAADCAGYGFRFEATPRAGFKDGERVFGEPNRLFDLTLSVRRPDGRRTPLDIRTLPFVRFEGNTAHNIANYALNLGQDAGGVGPDKDHPFVVRDMTIWNAQRGYTVDVPHVRIDGMRIHWCGYEIYRAHYRGQDYRDVRLSGIRGKYEVSDRETYLASGEAVGQAGVGLNRARLPGFPAGAGGGGNSYQPSAEETTVLDPVDDLPPVTVITHVLKRDVKLLVRGTCADNGGVKGVTVNGVVAKATELNFAQWEAELPATDALLTAQAEDAAGNAEKTPHVVGVPAR